MRNLLTVVLIALIAVLVGCPITPDPNSGIPNAPADLTAEAISSTSVRLSWPAVAGATGYALERKTGPGAFSGLAQPTGTEYLDSGLTPQTAYTYRIKSVKGVASSDWREKSVTTPAPAANTEKLYGTVVVIGSEEEDFGNGTTVPIATQATALFTKQTNTQTPTADPFLGLREKCYDTSSATNLFAALKLPLPPGSAIDAGSSITLQTSTSSAFGSLAKTAVGQYNPNVTLPQNVPESLKVTVPGASGGFPASSDTIAISGTGPRLQPQRGFGVNEPPMGTQQDLTDSITRRWNKGPAAPSGAYSAVFIEFVGITDRNDHAMCVVNDDGEFIFGATDPAFVMLKQRNTSVRFESSARAVARVKTIGSNAYLTTIIVDRTVAVAPN